MRSPRKGNGMKFLFVRHGETDWNVKKKIQGKTDIPLNKTGERQAEELAQKLVSQKIKVAKIYTSPQLRAKKTAEILAEALQLNVYIESGVREMDLGQWEGRKWENIKKEDGERYLYWNTHRRYAKTPEGECYNDVVKRTLQALERIAQKESEDVLVVTHSAVIMALFCYLEEQPFEEEIMIRRYKLENAEVTEVGEEKIRTMYQRFQEEEVK